MNPELKNPQGGQQAEVPVMAIVQVALVPGPQGAVQVNVESSLEPLAAIGLLEAGKAALLAQTQAPRSRLVTAQGNVPRTS